MTRLSRWHDLKIHAFAAIAHDDYNISVIVGDNDDVSVTTRGFQYFEAMAGDNDYVNMITKCNKCFSTK